MPELEPRPKGYLHTKDGHAYFRACAAGVAQVAGGAGTWSWSLAPADGSPVVRDGRQYPSAVEAAMAADHAVEQYGNVAGAETAPAVHSCTADDRHVLHDDPQRELLPEPLPEPLRAGGEPAEDVPVLARDGAGRPLALPERRPGDPPLTALERAWQRFQSEASWREYERAREAEDRQRYGTDDVSGRAEWEAAMKKIGRL
jgi:hypothetical protein